MSLFIIVCLWKPYFLFKKDLEKVLICIDRWGKYTFMFLGTTILCTNLIDKVIYIQPITWNNFIFYSLFVIILFAVIYTLIMYLFSKSLRVVFKRLLFSYIFKR